MRANKLADIIFYFCIMLFIVAFGFRDTMPTGNWYQQFLPTGLPNFQVSDMIFLDSLTGFVVAGNGTPNDTSGYILKTTNGGDNWILKFTDVRDFTRIKFINNNTGFASAQFGSGARLYKTTNGGDNWFSIGIPGGGQIYFNDMAVLNEDTIWYACQDGLVGGVFLTTNGGTSWTRQLNLGSQNPNHVYFYNVRIGFIGKDNVYLRKTTDSGLSWTLISGTGGFTDMYFADSLTGWKTSFQKTTDGGLNWINQTLPQGGMIITSQILKFSNINRDTIWGAGGWVQYPNFQSRGILYRTTNRGTNWLFQVPDTSINIFQYSHNKFVNKPNGWAYSPIFGIHTTNGGDTTFLLPVHQINSEIPKEFILGQNYPNPFNPRTKIKYQIVNSKYVLLKVFDISGREVSIIVNQKQNAGTYEVDFDGTNFSSGIYFYSLIVDGALIDTKKMILIK